MRYHPIPDLKELLKLDLWKEQRLTASVSRERCPKPIQIDASAVRRDQYGQANAKCDLLNFHLGSLL
jgi:hypothetical protein